MSFRPPTGVRLMGNGSPPRPCLKPIVTSCSLHPSEPAASGLSPIFDAQPSSHSLPTFEIPVPPPLRVHFPPTPTLCTTFPTHSNKTYDRRSLVVSPNLCAIPARGCPGRTYVPGLVQRRGAAARYSTSMEDMDMIDIPFDGSTFGGIFNPDEMDVDFGDLQYSPSSTFFSVPTPNLPTADALGRRVSSSESTELQSPVYSHNGGGGARALCSAEEAESGLWEMDMDSFPPPPGYEREREQEPQIYPTQTWKREEVGKWKMDMMGLTRVPDAGSCFGGF